MQQGIFTLAAGFYDEGRKRGLLPELCVNLRPNACEFLGFEPELIDQTLTLRPAVIL